MVLRLLDEHLMVHVFDVWVVESEISHCSTDSIGPPISAVLVTTVKSSTEVTLSKDASNAYVTASDCKSVLPVPFTFTEASTVILQSLALMMLLLLVLLL